MKKYAMLLWFSMPFCYVYAQSLTVLDKQEVKPIADALVYTVDQTHQTFTDAKGQVNLSGFPTNTEVILQHPSYLTQRFLWKGENANVLLSAKSYSLDEVVVSGSRWEETQRDITNQVVKIKARDIAFDNPATTADVIANTGEVYVQKSQLGGGSPMLRGFSANSILLVIDGVRMNNAIYRSGNLQNSISVDANQLESAEVLFGPGSVLFGSDALGGVINFTTFQPRFSGEEKSVTEAHAFVRYASAYRERTAHVDFSFGRKKLAFATNLTYSSFGDLRTGQNRANKYGDFGLRNWTAVRFNGRDTMLANTNPHMMWGSGYDQFNIQQKVSYQPNKNLRLDYGLYYAQTGDVPRYDRLVELRNGMPRSAEWYYGKAPWLMHRLGLHLTKPIRAYDEAKIVLAYQHLEESRVNRNFDNFWRRTQTEEVEVLTSNFDFKKHLQKGWEVYYGGEWLINTVRSTASRENIETGVIDYAATRYPNGGSEVMSSSAYGQVVYKPNEQITWSAGARYNYYTLAASLTDTITFQFPFDEIGLNTQALTGSVGMVYNLDKWRLNTSLSSGYRAPNVDDIAKVFDSEPGTLIVPNDELGPEYSYSAEVGISRTFAERFTLTGNVYYTHVRDAIERRNFTYQGEDSVVFDGVLSRVTANVNAGNAYIFGFTLHALADVNEWLSLSASATYTEGKDRTNDIPLRHIPPFFGQAAAVFKAQGWRTELYTNFAGNKPLSGLPLEEQSKVGINYTEQGTLSWATLNLKTSYQAKPWLMVQLGVENIFDTFYHPFASGISAPGRNVILTLRATL
ncbi:TonB-dependent receptor [Cytophagales bacterium LB-30]|uniref:TonB-dependent receptor n=1 Tax=Shiella aurantiaca TaxID=3058365 RepID=A0ABT8F4Q2_9BACT|nr:TonB-dependent receptor [Shiella aurantiaca]MDN4164961.1 TonB-dependent receptor [Shiella aurantiaca]